VKSFKTYKHRFPTVNFINVKRTNFSYKRRILAAFSSYMYVEKLRSYENFVHKMLMKCSTQLASFKGLQNWQLFEEKFIQYKILSLFWIFFESVQ